MEDKGLTNEQLMQAYSNACAQLGNTQGLIHELNLRMDSLARDISKLKEKYDVEVSQTIQLRKELELRSTSERQNKDNKVL